MMSLRHVTFFHLSLLLFLAAGLATLIAPPPRSLLAATIVADPLIGDTTWTKAGSPYLVDTLEVPPGATLTIEPGVVVKLNFTSAFIEGTIRALGTPAEPVIFTSAADDTAGGDTNEDGNGSTPFAGDWRIDLAPVPGSASSTFAHTQFRYPDSVMFTTATATLDHVAVVSTVHGMTLEFGSIVTASDFSLSGSLGNGLQLFDASRMSWNGGSASDIAYHGVMLFGGSALDARNISLRSTGQSGLQVYEGSRVRWEGGVISDTGMDAVNLFDASSFDADNLVIADPIESALRAFDGSRVTIASTTIRSGPYATYAVALFGSFATMTHATMPGGAESAFGLIENRSGAFAGPARLALIDSRVENFSNPEGAIRVFDSALDVRRSVIKNNAGGIRVFTGRRPPAEETTTVANSAIAGNGFGVEVLGTSGTTNTWNHSAFAVTPVLATQNYWGDPSGPFHPNTNPFGAGDTVSDDVVFAPWLNHDPTIGPPPCTVNCYANVLFLPGTESSRLYRPDYQGGTEQLWEPGGNDDVRDLFLDNEGNSIRDDIYTKDVIRTILGVGGDIYDSFLDELEKLKTNGSIVDFSVTPYDWRLALSDLVHNGTKFSDGRIYYAGTNAATGTPYIVQELRRLATTSRTGKVTIVAHSNGGLLAKYLLASLGDTEAAQLVDKLILVAVPQTGTPQAVGAALNGFDAGLPYDGFPLLMTPATARTFSSTSPMVYHLLPSAAYQANVATPLATFVDGPSTQIFITRYGHAIGNVVELRDFLLGADGRQLSPVPSDLIDPAILHGNLLDDATTVHNLVDNWISPASVTVDEIAGWGEDTLASIRYESILHRDCRLPVPPLPWLPLECDPPYSVLGYTPETVVDGDGTVVTPSALAMPEGEGVKRWWVNLFDFNKDNSERVHKDIFEVQELRDFIINNRITSSSTTPPRFVTKQMPGTEPNTPRLRFILHSPVTLSARDPLGNITNAATSTIPGARYKRYGEVQVLTVPASSTPTMTLTGEAIGSFTLNMEELAGDDVIATATYAAIPVMPDTVATVNFPDGTLANATPLHIDIDGNGTVDYALAARGSGTVTLDTTPPEARLVFATTTRKLAILGHDSEGATIVRTSATSSTVTDMQGNTLRIPFLSYKEKNRRIALSFDKLVYNGIVQPVPKTALAHKWNIDKRGKYTMFAAYIKSGTTTLEMHYRPKQNVTIIMEKPRDLDDSDSDDECDKRSIKKRLPGIVVPGVETLSGNARIVY